MEKSPKSPTKFAMKFNTVHILASIPSEFVLNIHDLPELKRLMSLNQPNPAKQNKGRNVVEFETGSS